MKKIKIEQISKRQARKVADILGLDYNPNINSEASYDYYGLVEEVEQALLSDFPEFPAHCIVELVRYFDKIGVRIPVPLKTKPHA